MLEAIFPTQLQNYCLIMLSLWRCDECNLLNPDDKLLCQACFSPGKGLSLRKQIVHDQKLLFHGFIRTEIINDLSRPFNKLLSRDVTNLCNKFYALDIKLLMSAHLKIMLKDDCYDYS